MWSLVDYLMSMKTSTFPFKGGKNCDDLHLGGLSQQLSELTSQGWKNLQGWILVHGLISMKTLISSFSRREWHDFHLRLCPNALNKFWIRVAKVIWHNVLDLFHVNEGIDFFLKWERMSWPMWQRLMKTWNWAKKGVKGYISLN